MWFKQTVLADIEFTFPIVFGNTQSKAIEILLLFQFHYTVMTNDYHIVYLSTYSSVVVH